MRSANESKGWIGNEKLSNKLQGPPHKKFGEFDSSIS